MIENPSGSAFDHVANMQTTVGTEGSETVKLLGYYNPGDGGGGDFYWDSSSTAAINGGTVIEGATMSGAGRWIRLTDKSDFVSVIGFGAKGDGVYDDTTAIQNALNAWPKVIFPQFIPNASTPANYNFGVSASLNVTLDRAHIKGTGTITRLSGSEADSIFTITAANATFEGINLVL